MATPSYAVPGLTLSSNPAFSQQAADLQRDLRSLGYASGPIDGVYGAGTIKAVQALQYDLLHNDGSSSKGDGQAPVAMTSYNNGNVTALTGTVDQNLASCIVAMLNDPAYPKIPTSGDAVADNASAVAAVKAKTPSPVPIPYLIAILNQESDCCHYQVPHQTSTDSFVTIGLDRNNTTEPVAITSRGYGIGQYTLFHHPPTQSEMNNQITDPVTNVNQAVSDLLDKFTNFVAGSTSETQADDRIADFGHGPSRPCQYSSTDPKYMTDCSACLSAAGSSNIQSGVTPVFAGSADTYQQTQYHKGNYSNVPVRSAIPCDWPYAVRRYNGSGPNSYDYQAEVLLRIVDRPI
jgi:peptidoglycan hydrolase-like protein with peptidoglycan-binding domain